MVRRASVQHNKWISNNNSGFTIIIAIVISVSSSVVRRYQEQQSASTADGAARSHLLRAGNKSARGTSRPSGERWHGRRSDFCNLGVAKIFIDNSLLCACDGASVFYDICDKHYVLQKWRKWTSEKKDESFVSTTCFESACIAERSWRQKQKQECATIKIMRETRSMCKDFQMD